MGLPLTPPAGRAGGFAVLEEIFTRFETAVLLAAGKFPHLAGYS